MIPRKASFWRILSARALMVAAALALTAVPATAPAAAQASLLQRDKAQGTQAHRQIVQQFGGVVDGPLADYVRMVGLKVAVPSVPGSRPSDWTITVLDSPVPNAMATPGGYLYITRGLLAMMNSEAELASVLGHEAGHVAARHSQRRNSRAVIGALGTVAAAMLGGSQAGQMANLGASAWVSGFSRAQENEADRLGMRYSMAAGYDPRAAAWMLQSLERVAALEGRQSLERGGLASIFSTHPVTAERVRRVTRDAAATGRTGIINREQFLAVIDGMTFGDSPEQGIVTGSSFRHAGLRIGFDAPPGFLLQNSPQSVAGQAGDGSSFLFVGARTQPDQPLEELVSQAWRQLANGRIPQIQYSERRINGLDAALSSARIQGNRGVMDVGIHAYRTAPDQVYLVRTIAPAGRGQMFDPLVASFRRLTPVEVEAAARGRRIDVVTVQPGDTLRSLAARMAPPYNREMSVRALNGIEDRPLRAGEQLKLIVG